MNLTGFFIIQVVWYFNGVNNSMVNSVVYRSINYIGSRAKWMYPDWDHVNFASDPMQLILRQTAKKNKFIAYIYLHFCPEFYKKSGIRAKIEPEKLVHTVFLRKGYWCHDVTDVQSDCKGSCFILTSLTVMWRRVTRCNYWNVNFITSSCCTIGVFRNTLRM